MITVLHHPFGARQMVLERPPDPIRVMFWIKMQHHSCDFAPVRTFRMRVEQAQIRDEVLVVVRSTRYRRTQYRRHHDLRAVRSEKCHELTFTAGYAHGQSTLRGGEGSVQGALNAARPPEVGRFDSFVKPTADWFQQCARLIRPSLHPPEFCKACRGA